MGFSDEIYEHIDTDAAIRTRFKLQPAGGTGTKVFPPTYQGDRNSAVYATERRKLDDGSVADCVLLDSVQSQANRMEDALKMANSKSELTIPLIQVNFTPEFTDLGKISTLDAPHRIADAIFRESTLDGTPFRKTEHGRMFENSSMNNAGGLYRICPTALLFGAWDSTGERGGRGTKFPRAITSEIVGIGVEEGINPTGRISPVDITGTDPTLYETEGGQLTHDEDEALDPDEAMKPSEANLGNVTPSFSDHSSGDTLPGGVTMDYAELSAVISLSGLRRLSFPENGQSNPERTRCARSALAALGLVAVAKQYEMGYSLRSRCDLVAQKSLSFELVKRNGDIKEIDTSIDETVEAFVDLHERAAEHGLDWEFESLDLEPTETLIEEIRRSRAQVAE